MILMTLHEIYIARSKHLSAFVHEEQKRYNGEPYINHPKRLVNEYTYKTLGCVPCDGLCINRKSCKLTDDIVDDICGIWLHDVLEDSGKNSSCVHDLIQAYFRPRVWGNVFGLTYYPKHETYNNYIIRLTKFPTLLEIKFLDIIDNTTDKIPEKQWNKYKSALTLLHEKRVEIPSILLNRFNICPH